MGFWFIMHVVICVLLVATILFQDGKTGGLVSVADAGQSVFGAKGASSFLTKLTSGLALAFMILSLILAFSSSPSNKSIASDFVPTIPETPGGLTTTAPVDTDAAQEENKPNIEIGGTEADKVESVDTLKKEDLPEELRQGLEKEQAKKEKEEEEKKKKEEDQKKPDDQKE